MRLRIFAITVAATLVALMCPSAFAEWKVPGTKRGFVKTSDGVKIHYLDAGAITDPSKFVMHPNPGLLRPWPVVLLVPGWSMPAQIWEHQIQHFAKRTRVVAMDPRGQGESSKPNEGYHPSIRARDIKAVIDQLKLAPVVLVGWSMGVTEVAAYVEQFGTADLAGVVLVDGIAGADFDPKMTPQMYKFAATFLTDRQKNTDQFVRTMYRKPHSEDYLKRVIAASLSMPTDSAVAAFLGTFTSDYRPALAKIDKPALVMAAGDDASNPWMKIYRDLAQRIPGAKLEMFPGSGHALFVDDPARFNSLLEGFLVTIAAKTPGTFPK